MSNKDDQVNDTSVDSAKTEGKSGNTSQKTNIKISKPYLEIIIGDGYGDNPFGHASLRVVDPESKKHIIYDFGRYGKIKPLGGTKWTKLPDSINKQLNKLQGEGILRIHNGEKTANGYMNRQQVNRNSRGYIYFLKEKEVKKVFDHFDALIKSSKGKGSGGYILEDWTPTHNCTTVTLEGARASGKLIIGLRLSTGTIAPDQLEYEIKSTKLGLGRYDEKREYPKK